MTRTELICWAQDEARFTISWKPLRSCKACYTRVNDSKGKSYYILRSYSTIVAVYSESTGTVYEFDRYSTTTSQHVYKFALDMMASYITHLYIRSDKRIETCFGYVGYRPTKEEWKNVLDTDYAIEIETINK